MGPTTVAAITAACAQLFFDGGLGARVPARHTAPSATAATTTGSAPAPVRGRVSGVAVSPVVTGAHIVIALDSGVSVQHFTLDGPSRLVLDLGGASLSMRGGYDGRTRGPIRNVRLAQYRSDTVRVVIDLDAAHQYTVSRDGSSLLIAVQAPGETFARWETGTTPVVAAGSSTRYEAVAAAAAPMQSTAAGSLAAQSAQTAQAERAAVRAERAERAAEPTPYVDNSRIVKAGDNQKLQMGSERMEGTATAAPTRRQQQKPRITVQYDGTDIRDVIASFATFSGRTIVVGKDVAGTVTADISDKPWDVALQAILQAQGLAATEDASGIITVDSYRNLASNQALEPLVTQIIDVNYAKASQLQSTVQALLARDCTSLSTMATSAQMGANTSGSGGSSGMSGQGCVVRGSISADSATNKLIITEVPSRLPEIIARLKELDVRTQQVAIKAKIIFVNRTGITDIGLAYDLGTGNKQFFQQLVPRTDPNTLQPVDTDGDGVPDATGGGTPFEGPARIALGGNAIAGIANANNAIKPNALNLIYSTALGRYQLTAFLNALQTSALADVQSEPSITILNNRSAEIFVGQEIPIRVIDASAGGGGGGGSSGGGNNPNAAAFFPRATVSKEEAGIKLSVTPQITNNRMVLLNIKAENSSAELSNTDVGVVFNRQRAESQVLVADGEAAVIGGLTVTENTRFRSGIPILMNLPFIGRLFSQNTKNETKRDLLILVTPHILEDGPTPPPGR
jgi:type IV pilus assembly protein PilQ